ncbi:hypothetical protein DCAR_0415902 [Daucus carota subsp. sativus]|uniref:CCHC-type domain-containing protein n=1 Tax=Daucus carota subsp. sativus TaxID=79200 RepID=A0AAF0WX46_DAUCS|nr:hypothetical protein DCAR_0415902 [Daucus carota subsp. sativus]
MEKENCSPIQTILNGSNYIIWSQAMRSFLKGKRLWRYVNGDFTIPTKEKDEADSKFKDRIEEWDVKNHQAITFFRNSSVSKINLQFGNYDTAKEIWDLLASRYTTSDLSHQYQIMSSLSKQKQEPGQPVADFLSQIQSLWDQLTLSEPKWLYTEDATLYHTYRDQQRLIQFLMALTQDFEPVRAALLHRVPLPSLESSVAELISEETRLGLGKLESVVDNVLAVPSVSTSDKPFCRFCRQSGHVTKDCITLRNHTCQHCHQKGHYSIQFCKKKPSFHSNKFTQSSAAVTSESPTTSTSELESLLKQVLLKANSPSTAFSVTSDPSIELTQPSPTTNVPLTEVQSEDSNIEPSTQPSPPEEPVRSTRVRKPSVRLSDYHVYSAIQSLHEPQTYREASTSSLVREIQHNNSTIGIFFKSI